MPRDDRVMEALRIIERIPAYILLSTVMLVICIRQAAGFAIARVELSRNRS